MRTLLDVDDVLAGFMYTFEQKLDMMIALAPNKKRPCAFDLREHLNITTKEMEKAFSQMRADTLPLTHGAIEAVGALAKLGEVYFVTAYPTHNATWVRDRDKWLRFHFGELGKNVIHTSCKHVCVGDLFVDDKATSVFKWAKLFPKGRAILWERPHSGPLPTTKGVNNILVTTSWEVVLTEANKVKERIHG